MFTIQQLIQRAAGLTYGLVTLLLFIFFAFWEGSLFKRSTEKEKNELKLAQGRLWNLSKHPNGLTHAFYTLPSGSRLHYVYNQEFSRESSSREPKNLIIFLHGFPDSWALWRHFIASPALRLDNVLIAVDLPGYGGSDSLRSYGATEVLESVTEFVIGMRRLYGIDSELDTSRIGTKPGVIIVGHDWGCIIGARLAAEAPQLADRFILSNAPIPALTMANAERIVSSSAKMLTTFAHHPLSSRSLLGKALFTLSPLLSQLRKSGYAFVFNLPLPLVSLAGSMGNFWFLRTCHQLAADKDHPFDSKHAAEAMASSHGPGVYECISMTEAEESYPTSVRNRSASGGFTEKIRYYREGLFSDSWVKSLETLTALYEIDWGRRPSTGAALFEGEPKGSLKAKTTVVWGLLDAAVDQRMALQGIGDYLPRGSQVVVLPRTAHWTPNPGMGREALEKVVEWAAGGEKGDLRQMVTEVYERGYVHVKLETTVRPSWSGSCAMVLAHSLRDNGTKKRLAVLVTLDNLNSTTIEELKKLYDDIIPVDRIANRSPANLYLMNRPDLVSSFTKIALWKQTQFRKIVYIDADVVALRAPDELFKQEAPFAAVPDIGWPDCFNSGVFVLSPNLGDYYALLALAQRGISFDGADQGMLNMHFRDWQRLSFTYNCTPSGNYQYVPAYRHFQSSISMVHYIGQEKPWSMGREVRGANGVYEELLGRWWAVYDRHYRATSAMSGQSKNESRTVQQYVAGEASGAEYGFSSTAASEDNVTKTEPPLTENIERSESIQQGEATSTPTVQQMRFSAPMTEWDPVHAPPPTKSRPEASKFPNETYTMSSDTKLFQAPSAYPQPPKDMYYQVPATPPAAEPPKPIFPWEEHRSKPTRVFPEDKPPSPEPSVTSPSITTDEDTVGPSTPATQSSAEPFASYTHTNAWDDVPEIEHYISTLQHHRRAKVQVLVNTAAATEPLLSPDAASTTPKERRPSVKLTDFPTEIERPSLPVTPAPVRRPSFWGEERDEAGDLPAAEGVPKQEHWNPVARLEELQRRQTKMLGQEPPTGQQRDIPDRILPGSAEPASKDDPGAVPRDGEELDFGARNVERSGEDEGVFSATES